MNRIACRLLLACVLAQLPLEAGCHSPLGTDAGSSASGDRSAWRLFRRQERPAVRSVVCLFDQRPWLNADAAGDRDPEGLQYRVFLNTGEGKAKFRKGTFHIELYQIERGPDGRQTRTMVSDWHYPSTDFTTVQARIMGEGYHVQLSWARKDIAGHEIELVTKFEDANGRIARSGTKRLRVPKYVS